MAFTGPLEDRTLIRERMSAYADAAFRRDRDAWLANWTEDCRWVGTGFDLTGKAALAAQWPKLWSGFDAMTFFIEVGAIEVDGDRAAARCFTFERLALKGGGLRDVVGRYEDQLVRQNGQWLFAVRNYNVVMDGDKPGGA